MPGAPRAKVEKSRRTTYLQYALRHPLGSPKRPYRGTLLSESHLDNASFHSDHGSVGAIFRA